MSNEVHRASSENGARTGSAALRNGPGLRVADTMSIIVGIVIGTAIFRTAPVVFQNSGSPNAAIGIWAFGGVLAFCGALCYAELATAFPRNGGDYEYLTRAYGRWVGFFFGWSQLTIILAGNIGSMAYAFADYASGLANAPSRSIPWIAAVAVIVVTGLNLAGIVAGRATQNLLTLVKVVGLSGIVIAGIVALSRDVSPATSLANATPAAANWGLALVFVMFAYGGWNDCAFVAAEVRDVERNLPRALLLGLGIVALIYLAINLVYLGVLGFDGASQSRTPAADVAKIAIGDWGDRAIRILVMISALGAINGLVLTGSRVYAVFGQDNPALSALGRWNRKAETPVAALVTQGVITVVTILIVGTESGQASVNRILTQSSLPIIPWEKYFGGFDTLVAATAPTFWLFFFLTGGAVFILRWKTPASDYRYRMPLYPLPAILFCGSSLFMLYKTIVYAEWLTLIGTALILIGVPFGFFHRLRLPDDDAARS